MAVLTKFVQLLFLTILFGYSILFGLFTIFILKDPVVNTNMSGYLFASQSSLQNAGGVGFYIRNNCDFHFRDDPSCATDDFEYL